MLAVFAVSFQAALLQLIPAALNIIAILRLTSSSDRMPAGMLVPQANTRKFRRRTEPYPFGPRLVQSSMRETKMHRRTLLKGGVTLVAATIAGTGEGGARPGPVLPHDEDYMQIAHRRSRQSRVPIRAP